MSSQQSSSKLLAKTLCISRVVSYSIFLSQLLNLNLVESDCQMWKNLRWHEWRDLRNEIFVWVFVSSVNNLTNLRKHLQFQICTRDCFSFSDNLHYTCTSNKNKKLKKNETFFLVSAVTQFSNFCLHSVSLVRVWCGRGKVSKEKKEKCTKTTECRK